MVCDVFFNNFTKNCFGNLFLQMVKLPMKKWAYAILSVFKDKGFHKEWNKLLNVICIRLLHVINYKYDYQINPLFQCNFTAVNICIFVLQNYTWTGRLGGNPDLCKFFFCQLTLIEFSYMNCLVHKNTKLTVLCFLATSMACFTSGGSSMTE